MNDKVLTNLLVKNAKRPGCIPKLQLVSKSSSWLMRAINVLFNLWSGSNKDFFLNRFWTTIKYTIYWPADKNRAEITQWGVIAHELVHCFQRKRWGILFPILYLFPINLAALLVLTCWLPVFWASGWVLAVWIPVWAAVGLLLFLPWIPDPWRSRWELQAYAVTIYGWHLKYGFVDDRNLQTLAKNFTGMSYYMMDPRKEHVIRNMKKIRDEIVLGTSWIFRNKNTKPAIALLHQALQESKAKTRGNAHYDAF